MIPTPFAIPALVTLRRVHVALIAGFLPLGGLFVALGAVGEQPQIDAKSAMLLLAACLALGLGLLIAQALLRRAALNQARRALAAAAPDAAARLERARSPGDSVSIQPHPAIAQSFASQSIARAALAEGFALVGLVLFYLSHEWYALVIPTLGLAALLLLFPTQAKLDSFAAQARSPA